MRDNYKSEEYYKKIYEQETFFIDSAEKRLKKVLDLKGPDFHTIPNCYTGIANDYFLRFYLSYTMGFNYDELLPDVHAFIMNASEGWTGEDFQILGLICSFSILFNIKNDYVKKVVSKTEQRLNDCKYGELFLKLVEPDFEVKADKTYYADDKAIVEVIELAETDKSAAVQRLKRYVDKEWFKTLTEGLITNTSRCYRGYWCIEAAALVKALGLDDSELKESKYYPYDMAHFCDWVSAVTVSGEIDLLKQNEDEI